MSFKPTHLTDRQPRDSQLNAVFYITNFPTPLTSANCRGTTIFFPEAHIGNGSLSESRNSPINSLTFDRRLNICSINRSITAVSPPYHSGGTASAIAHSVPASIASTRLSHGSKLSQPVTLAYTRFLG